jgi:hypothetical protein
VLLKDGQAWLQIPDHDPVEIGAQGGIRQALEELRDGHIVSGRWILVPGSSTPFDDVIAAIDAARAARFPHVTLASDPA